jgi:predicted ATP-grasp superfamily ATP-dependent carboligase
MKILIPDPLRRNVLAAIRSLSKKGYQITIAYPTPQPGDRDFHTLPILKKVYRSRYCPDIRFVASPFGDVDTYLSDLLKILRTERYDVVLPFSHSSVAAVCYGNEAIRAYSAIPYGSFDNVTMLHDKQRALQVVSELGIKIPETYFPNDIHELEHIATWLEYPVVVKARIGAGAKNVKYAGNTTQLLQAYKAVSGSPSYGFIENYDRPMIQKYIPGNVHDVALIADHGKIQGALTQVRKLTYPIDGGVGAVNETTNEPELVDLGRKVLESIRWHGPALAEFKLNPTNNQYVLMEINPRFWGTLDLSIKAGIDFADIACHIALGHYVKPQFNYTVGLTYRWITNEELLSVAQAPCKMFHITQFIIRFFKNNTIYDFTLRDVIPDVFKLFSTIALIITRKVPSSQMKDINQNREHR